MQQTPEQIRAEIKRRFVKLAVAPQDERKFPVGPPSAKRLGYNAQEIDSLPASVTGSFAGVGNLGRGRDSRGGRPQGPVVRLNRRCRTGAVAPTDAHRRRVQGGAVSRVDGLQNVAPTEGGLVSAHRPYNGEDEDHENHRARERPGKP
jgi:hypothetical protein